MGARQDVFIFLPNEEQKKNHQNLAKSLLVLGCPAGT